MHGMLCMACRPITQACNAALSKLFSLQLLLPLPADEEHAPNSIMQRAILTYINTTSPQLALKWQNAEVRLSLVVVLQPLLSIAAWCTASVLCILQELCL